MNNVIDFKLAKENKLKSQRKQGSAAAKKHTMCKNNHHKWCVQTAQRFDVKEGRLVTVYQCRHCGQSKTRLH